jgi:hypothetical protein
MTILEEFWTAAVWAKLGATGMSQDSNRITIAAAFFLFVFPIW